MTEEKRKYEISLNDIEYLPDEDSFKVKFPPLVLKKMFDQLLSCTIDGSLAEKKKNAPQGSDLCFEVEDLDTIFTMPLELLYDGRFIAARVVCCRDG